MANNVRRPANPTAAVGNQIAKSAGLRYVTDSMPGIRRQKRAAGFAYIDPSGKALRDASAIARIHSLVIPPAWADVWICPLENGHLQVTGRDAKGRKQYRYHARWRLTRDENKYEQLADFVRALPAIRKAVKAHLDLPGLAREKILAAVVRLLETTFIRVGNEKYARDNRSFGLTTFRNRHVRIRGQTLKFDFRGKSGKQHHIELSDRKLARIIRRCRELPGYELFQYLDENGEPRAITSSDVNEYLGTISAKPYTAKDFRTWAGTLLAALALQQHGDADSPTQAKKNVVDAISTVAQQLGNTPAICRKCYVHPAIIEAYLHGSLAPLLATPGERSKQREPRFSRRQELAVLSVLRPRRTGRSRSTPAVA